MIEIINKKNCMGCSACVQVCPRNAIEMRVDPEGFQYPVVDYDACVHCDLCSSVCPIDRKVQKEKRQNLQAYAAVNMDAQMLDRSSSGGIFTIIAESILADGGVVFGAAFSEDFRCVNHIAIESKEELEALRGSKYLQSSIGNTYRQTKDYLETGRKVLFTGTPCQIAGMYGFLKKSYTNLYTLDVICHGVPSPLAWEKYLEYHEKKAGEKILQAYFRIKNPSWKEFSLQLLFCNGKEYRKKHYNDMYMRCFLKNLDLRPSCYACKFKLDDMKADCTLGDFWGIEGVLPEAAYQKGVSLVLVRTEKGNALLSGVMDKLWIQKVDVPQALAGNPAAVKSVAVPEKRSEFMEDLQRMPPDMLFRTYGQPNIYKRIKRLIHSLLFNIKRICRKVVYR